MADILITTSSQLQTQFSQRDQVKDKYIDKVPKKSNDEMLEDGSELIRIAICLL